MGVFDVLTLIRRAYHFAFAIIPILVMTLLISMPLEKADAAVTANRGSFVLSFTGDTGDSQYTVLYSYPPSVSIGQNLTISLTLEVDQLTHLKLFVDAYEFDAALALSNGKAVSGKVVGPVGDPNEYLYQGSHWGPVNLTMPIRATDVGAFNGGSIGGNLSVGLISTVWYDLALPAHPQSYPETDSRIIGPETVTTASGFASSGYLGYVALAAVAVFIVGGVWLARRGRKPSSTMTA